MLTPKLTFGIILGLLGVLAFMLAYRSSHDKSSDFDFAQAFIDADGKTSLWRIGVFVALATSTWSFVYLVLNDKMSEWYFTGYMAIWVLGGANSKWTEKLRSPNPGDTSS